MPAFFILSGFTIQETLKEPLSKHLQRRAKSLLLPYLLFSLCWICFSYAKNYVTKSNFSVLSALCSIFLLYSGRIGGNVYIYWFLPCLFLAYLACALTIYLPSKQKLAGVILWTVFLAAGEWLASHGSLLICTAMAFLFIGIGYALRSFGGKSKSLKFLCFAIFTTIQALCIYLNNNTLDFSSALFGNVLFFIPCAVAGTLSWAIISQAVAECGKINKYLVYIGKNSLAFYMIHFFFNSICGFFNLRESISFFAVLTFTTLAVMFFNKSGLNKLFQGDFFICRKICR